MVEALDRDRVYVGSIDHLEALYSFFAEKGYRIYGLKKKGDSIVYGYIDGFNEYRDYLTAKNKYIAMNSPKNVLNPPTQLVFKIDKNYRVEEHGLDMNKTVLFGIKTCDLKAVNLLDKFLENDPAYARRRGNIRYVIVEDCLEPYPTCFCNAVGSGPVADSGFDLSYSLLNGKVLFRPGSSTGFKLVEHLGLRKASEKLVSEYRVRVEEASSKTRLQGLAKSIGRTPDLFWRLMGREDFWIRVSKNCIGCGNCNMVCPTCFCTEFLDEVVEGGGARYRRWIGCLSYTYGLVAGGHYRPMLYMRLRHFILHKYLFSKIRYGALGCTGCGRCIYWCPMGVDVRKVVEEASLYG